MLVGGRAGSVRAPAPLILSVRGRNAAERGAPGIPWTGAVGARSSRLRCTGQVRSAPAARPDELGFGSGARGGGRDPDLLRLDLVGLRDVKSQHAALERGRGALADQASHGLVRQIIVRWG